MPNFLRSRTLFGSVKEEDPLTKALEPPEHETQQERQRRLAAQADAQRISDGIDEEINRQRLEIKKTPKPVRVLLLGAFSFACNHL